MKEKAEKLAVATLLVFIAFACWYASPVGAQTEFTFESMQRAQARQATERYQRESLRLQRESVRQQREAADRQRTQQSWEQLERWTPAPNQQENYYVR